MKIGIEVQRLFRKKKFGIEFSSLELIKKLTELEPNNEFVIFAKSDEDVECLMASENLKIKTVAGRFFADFEQVFLPIAAGREQVDVLHCTGNTAPYFAPAPVVQTLHDVIFMDSIPSCDTFYQRFGNHYRRKVVPVVTPRSSAVITVSEHEKERIVQRLGVDPGRIHVVYNGLNQKRFHKNKDITLHNSIKGKFGLPDEFILFLGNTSFRKNPERVIQAYVKYANGTAKPMGLVTPGLSKDFIVQRLKKLNYPYNSQQFITPGYISDAELPAFYSMCKIFMFPSISEGFGMPIIEAMACGAPVITSNVSCMPEIAGNAGVLTDPYDTDNMAEALMTVATNDQLRMEKISAGLVNAKRFSWDRAAERVLNLYELVYQQERSMQKVPGFLGKHMFATRH